MQKRKWQRKQKLSLIFEHIALLNLESRWGGHYFGFPKKEFCRFFWPSSLVQGQLRTFAETLRKFYPPKLLKALHISDSHKIWLRREVSFQYESLKKIRLQAKYLPSLEFDISVGGIGKVCLPRSAQRRNWVFVSRSIYQMVSDLQLGPSTHFKTMIIQNFEASSHQLKMRKWCNITMKREGPKIYFNFVLFLWPKF